MSDNESDTSFIESIPEFINCNISGVDPEDSDFHMIKKMIDNITSGLPDQKSINLSEIARHVISLSGKIGSVLINCDEPVEQGDDVPVPCKKPKTQETEVEEASEEDDDPAEDAILGLCSAIEFKHVPKVLCKIYETHLGQFDEKSIWLINDRPEALPIAMGLPMLKTTLSEMQTHLPKTETIVVIAKGYINEKALKNNKPELADVEFNNDEYSMLIHEPQIFIKSKIFIDRTSEKASRSNWEDANPEYQGTDQGEEGDSVSLTSVRVLFSFEKTKLVKFVDRLGNVSV